MGGVAFFKVPSIREKVTKFLLNRCQNHPQFHKNNDLEAFKKRTSTTRPESVNLWLKTSSKMGSQKVIFLMFLRFLVQGVSLGLPGTLPRCKSDAKGRKIESPSACCGTLSGPLWLSRLGARKVTTKSCYPAALFCLILLGSWRLNGPRGRIFVAFLGPCGCHGSGLARWQPKVAIRGPRGGSLRLLGVLVCFFFGVQKETKQQQQKRSLAYYVALLLSCLVWIFGF